MEMSFSLVSAISATLALGCGCVSTSATKEFAVRYVDEFDLSRASCGMGKTIQSCRSVDGHVMMMCGKTYARGFGAHPESALAFTSNGKVVSFDAEVGIDDDAAQAKAEKSYGRPAAQFNVWADGRIVWTSGVLQLNQKPVRVHVDLLGVKEIVLETRGGSAWQAWDAANGDWADACFVCETGACLKQIVSKDAYEQLDILTPPEKEEPQFNGADIFGVRPGREVIFRIPVSGVRPMRFEAESLPDGVALDADRGVLKGVAPFEKGDYDISITAENVKGKARRSIRLSVGDNISLTPPMGWNSWNVWCHRLTQKHAMDSALALERSGLGDHGWSYVNLDDFWQMNNRDDVEGRPNLRGRARDRSGKIIPNPDFPDMRVLTDFIHSFGFKAGIYSSPGKETCGGCEGNFGHELQDAESWAAWGFDYVKYDWCSYKHVLKQETGLVSSSRVRSLFNEGYAKPYRIMNDCLKKQNRDIVYSLCQYGMGEVERWKDEVGANCWRTWTDLKDTWNWMELAIDGHLGAEYWKYNKPGCWADPDMLLVGQQYSFGTDHMTYLTHNEQYTHVSLWAMVGAPLLIGCDLTTIDDFTKNLLVNDSVIAVNQDRLGQTARRIRHVDSESVWMRQLADGAIAVALVNRYPIKREISVSFVELGLGDGEYWVKDLWRQQCEGRHSGKYVVQVPSHATKLIYVRSVACSKCR